MRVFKIVPEHNKEDGQIYFNIYERKPFLLVFTKWKFTYTSVTMYDAKYAIKRLGGELWTV